MPGKYTVTEIAQMRGLIESLLISHGQSYNSQERALEVTGLLLAHVTNETPLEELRAAVTAKREGDRKSDEMVREMRRQYQDQEAKYLAERAAKIANLPPSRRALEVWFDDCIVRGGGREATELYKGIMGGTLTNWLKNNGEDGIRISQKEMETFLTEKGIASKTVNGILRFDCAQLISGIARSGNFMT